MMLKVRSATRPGTTGRAAWFVAGLLTALATPHLLRRLAYHADAQASAAWLGVTAWLVSSGLTWQSAAGLIASLASLLMGLASVLRELRQYRIGPGPGARRAQPTGPEA